MSDIMKIFLARHGQSNFNKKHLFSGQGDAKLTAKGKAQAKRSGNFFSKKKIDAIYHSPLSRAFQTAKIIFSQMNSKPEMLERKGLMEINQGRWEGRNPETFKGKEKELEQKWRKNNFRHSAPGGETFFDLQKRLKPVLKEILESGFENIIVVSHHGTNMVLMRLLFGLSEKETMEIRMPNNVIFEVVIKKGKRNFKKLVL